MLWLTCDRYFADKLSDIDPTQAPVLFRVVAGDLIACCHRLLPHAPSRCVDASRTVACLISRVTRLGSQAVVWRCRLRRLSHVRRVRECVRVGQQKRLGVYPPALQSNSPYLSPGLVVRTRDKRSLEIRMVSTHHGQRAGRAARDSSCLR